MPQGDLVKLRHMLDAATEAQEFVRGKDRPDLDEDRLLAHGVLRCIEIVGEAAARVSEGLKEQHPTIPWQDIVGMRNRLIHAYFDVDLDRVWDTLKDDLPPLVAGLRRIPGVNVDTPSEDP